MAIPRKTRLRSDKYNANITKRGLVSQQAAVEKKEKETSYVNPILVGFLFFVLAGRYGSFPALFSSTPRNLGLCASQLHFSDHSQCPGRPHFLDESSTPCSSVSTSFDFDRCR
jgi:hypothetical protein